MQPILNFLGLANRAGKVVSGQDLVVKAVQHRQAVLVIIANDASEQSKKLYIDKCRFYHTTYQFFATKDSLGNAIGKEARSACAILDNGFAKKLVSMIEQNSGGE